MSVISTDWNVPVSHWPRYWHPECNELVKTFYMICRRWNNAYYAMLAQGNFFVMLLFGVFMLYSNQFEPECKLNDHIHQYFIWSQTTGKCDWNMPCLGGFSYFNIYVYELGKIVVWFRQETKRSITTFQLFTVVLLVKQQIDLFNYIFKIRWFLH